jgi:hypothetical protein
MMSKLHHGTEVAAFRALAELDLNDRSGTWMTLHAVAQHDTSLLVLLR